MMSIMAGIIIGLGLCLLSVALTWMAIRHRRQNKKFDHYLGNLQLQIANDMKIMNVPEPMPMDQGILMVRGKDGNLFTIEIIVDDTLDSRKKFEPSFEVGKIFISPHEASVIRASGKGLDEAVVEILRASGKID